MRLFAVLIAAAATGCIATAQPFTRTNYVLGQEMSATVGSEMVSVVQGAQAGGSQSAFRQELLYGGVANGIVKVAYREYSVGYTDGVGGTYARPAFSQDLQYDLNQSKVLSFRDIRIEVIDAANDHIAYRVLAGPQGVGRSMLPPEMEGQPCTRTTECKSAALACLNNVCARWKDN